MIKRTTKKSVNSAILFASVFLISTAFMSNTIPTANAQEYDYEEDSYIYDIEKMDREKSSSSSSSSSIYENDYYKQDNKKDKKSPVVTIKKELFVCDEAQFSDGEFFGCFVEGFSPFIYSENSGKYIECTEELCPGIDESTFSAFIHKNIALIQDLNPQGKEVNINKFHYTVTEDQIDERNELGQGFFGSFTQFVCESSGFSDGLDYTRVLKSVGSDDMEVGYGICIVYEDDCQGIIHAGEEKTCTIKNYIFTNSAGI